MWGRNHNWTFQMYTSKEDNFGSLDWVFSAQLSKVNETGCWLLVSTRQPFPPSWIFVRVLSMPLIKTEDHIHRYC